MSLTMTDDGRGNPPQRVDLDQVAEIVSSYVRPSLVPADQLTALIIEVHRALAGLERPHRCRSASQSCQCILSDIGFCSRIPSTNLVQ
jgi:predicted transcriptional regulator